jgi:hypothetical protein
MTKFHALSALSPPFTEQHKFHPGARWGVPITMQRIEENAQMDFCV